MAKLQPAELHKYLTYDAASGTLYRKSTGSPVCITNERGDPSVSLLGKNYAARSVVWAMTNGYYPKRYQVRCVDGNRFNLKLDNFSAESHGHIFCRLCRVYKPISAFNKDASRLSGVGSECRECEKQNRKPKKDRAAWLKRAYNITEDTYNELAASQHGTCAICKNIPKAGKLVVDHCHKHEVVRALLCDPCNKALGLLRDDPIIAQSAADYLKSFTPQ